ncbi:MAG: hypothetical protein P1U56_15640 [Saprospiraceae bacterium]|nr:hypothetical protein [Saprospiraceae bacterium]
MDNLTAENLLPFVIGVLVGGVIYYFICRAQSAVPTAGLSDKLISNMEALSIIHNYQATAPDNTASGHLDLGVLLAYIDAAKTQCTAVGKDLSGLEYYFAKYNNDANNGNRPTIVMYPTYFDGQDQSGNDLHIPFDPFISTTGHPMKVKDMSDQYIADATDAARKSSFYTSVHALNRSNMSPPNPPLTL